MLQLPCGSCATLKRNLMNADRADPGISTRARRLATRCSGGTRWKQPRPSLHQCSPGLAWIAGARTDRWPVTARGCSRHFRSHGGSPRAVEDPSRRRWLSAGGRLRETGEDRTPRNSLNVQWAGHCTVLGHEAGAGSGVRKLKPEAVVEPIGAVMENRLRVSYDRLRSVTISAITVCGETISGIDNSTGHSPRGSASLRSSWTVRRDRRVQALHDVILAALLGHGSSTMTRRYTNGFERKQRIAEAIDCRVVGAVADGVVQ